MQVRGQLAGVGFLLLPLGSWELYSGWQAPFPTESSGEHPMCSLKVVSVSVVACSPGFQVTQHQMSGSPHYIGAEAQAQGEDSLT